MKNILLFLLFLPLSLLGQCDLVLTDVNIEEGTFTIEFVNTENCGGDADPNGISEIQIGFQALDPNNDCSAMNQGWTFPWGLTIPDDNAHPGWIYTITSSEAPFNWTNLWGDEYPDIDPPYYAGETITFPLYNQFQEDCVNGTFSNGLFCNLEEGLNFWLDQGLSIQAVIWQISYGPTVYAADGGWAEIGPNGDGTAWGSGLYEDENFEDNWLIIGPCEEQVSVEGCMDPIACNYNLDATQDDGSCVFCYTPYNEGLVCDEYHDSDGYWDWYLSLFPDCESPSDTIYIELPADTITVTDTLYVELPADTIYVVDTLTITVTEIDTVYVQLPPDTVTITETEFIFITDTVIETEYITVIDTTYLLYTDTVYVYELIEIDCETGLPCNNINLLGCENSDIYIPNSFTPNNDGINDAWEIVISPECWTDVDARVFNQWGEIVWESTDIYNLKWNGSHKNGLYYSQIETYTWSFRARRKKSSFVEDLIGKVTVIK